MRLRKTLSERKPVKDIKIAYNTERVCEDLERFIEEYLKGAARIDISHAPKGVIEISAQYLSYALRQIVKYGCLEGVVEFEVKGEDRFEILASFSGGLPDIRKLSDIFAAARKAGMSARIDDGRILLFIEFRNTTVLPLYEPKFSRFIAELYNMFFE